MSKVEAIDALMNCAIKAFSEWGFEGASLRQIAAQAGVPLSTINVYFGSKRDLYWRPRSRSGTRSPTSAMHFCSRHSKSIRASD